MINASKNEEKTLYKSPKMSAIYKYVITRTNPQRTTTIAIKAKRPLLKLAKHHSTFDSGVLMMHHCESSFLGKPKMDSLNRGS